MPAAAANLDTRALETDFLGGRIASRRAFALRARWIWLEVNWFGALESSSF